MTTPRYLSATNGFIPQATGQVIAFVRDPKKFKVNKYVQNIQTDTPVGVYAELDRDQPARVVTDAEFAWEDGDERPSGNTNLGNFKWTEFRVFRRDYPFTLGNQAVEVAKKHGKWDPVAFQASIVSQQAMTNRTKRVIDLLETTGNWGGNTSTANTLNGGFGFWDQSSNDENSPSYLAIKKSLLAAAQKINLGTNSIVQMSDLRLIVSPGCALKMAETAEIHDYLARSRFALPNLTGEISNPNELWGLPSHLYGMEVVVEDASRVSIRPNADGTVASMTLNERAYIKSDDSAIVVSRSGGLDGVYGSPSFSTVQCYFFEYELAVETFEDAKNKRMDGHVVEQFKEVLAAAPAGYLIQDVLS